MKSEQWQSLKINSSPTFGNVQSLGKRPRSSFRNIKSQLDPKHLELVFYGSIDDIFFAMGFNQERIMSTVQTKEPKLRHIDLCAGTGAFSLAFKQTGKIETIYANDILKSSADIYKKNFQDVFVQDDILKISNDDIPQFDIITSGFPCQPFSQAGKKHGFADSRSNVFWKLVEILKCHQPRFAIFENVKNLITHDNKKTFEIIVDALTKSGYKVYHKILDTHKFTGIPQHRERVYIVCIKNGIDINFCFPPNEKPNNYLKLCDILEKQVDDKFYYTDKLKVFSKIKETVVKIDTVYQYRRSFVRENLSGLVPTLTANMGHGGHNVPLILDQKGVRKLTPRECFNLQGFPKDFGFPDRMKNTELYALAGNAVSVTVVSKLIDHLLNLYFS